MNRTQKLLSALMVLPLPILFSGCAAESASEPALVRSAETYCMDYETGDWALMRRVSYEYQDAYPVTKTIIEPSADLQTVTTFEYEMNDGVPVLRKEFDSDGIPTSETVYNENGVIDRKKNVRSDGLSEQEWIYQYGLGDEYFTLVLNESSDRSAGDDTEHMEEVDSVTITEKNGLLQKTVNNGLYANWDEKDQPKEWMRFNGTYTAEYDDSGIVRATSAIYRAGPSGKEYRFELTTVNGRVTEAVRYRWSGTDEWMNDEKTIFEYTDTVISKSRYAAMINSFLLGETSTYYIFNWY